MVTEADREKKAIDCAERYAKSPHCTPEEHDDIMVAVRVARHRTASTAALTAENQRLRAYIHNDALIFDEIGRRMRDCWVGTGRSCTDGDASNDFRVWMNEAHNRNRALKAALGQSPSAPLAALSTPSEVSEPNPDEVAGAYSAFEVSEPVADESGGETMDWSEAVDFVDRFDLPISMVPDLVSPPNPTNGDAVREALLGGCLGISGNTLTFDAGNRADVETVFEHLLATLAKHGGADSHAG